MNKNIYLQHYISRLESTMGSYAVEIPKHIKALVAHNHTVSSFKDECVKQSFDTDTLIFKSTNSVFDISDTAWKCSVCFGIPRMPVTIKGCGHMGCAVCLETILASGPFADHNQNQPGKPCPVCRSHFTRGSLLHMNEWPMLAKLLWTQIRVKCETCAFTSDPASVVVHERSQCKHRTVACPGCRTTGTVQSIIDHVESCNRLMVYCSNCGYPIRYSNRFKHSCQKCLLQVQRNSHPDFVTGPKGHVSHAHVSVDDWVNYYDEASSCSGGKRLTPSQFADLIIPLMRGSAPGDIPGDTPGTSGGSTGGTSPPARRARHDNS